MGAWMGDIGISVYGAMSARIAQAPAPTPAPAYACACLRLRLPTPAPGRLRLRLGACAYACAREANTMDKVIISHKLSSNHSYVVMEWRK